MAEMKYILKYLVSGSLQERKCQNNQDSYYIFFFIVNVDIYLFLYFWLLYKKENNVDSKELIQLVKKKDTEGGRGELCMIKVWRMFFWGQIFWIDIDNIKQNWHTKLHAWNIYQQISF